MRNQLTRLKGRVFYCLVFERVRFLHVPTVKRGAGNHVLPKKEMLVTSNEKRSADNDR